MRVVLQHFLGDVPCDAADCLLAGLAFGQFCDGMMPEIVEA
jgi:hypothetical protein